LEELEAALRDFPGAVIAVSHDRRFLAGFGGVEVGIGM
jgi:macrolide transport system ATP-binding/permease protein